MSGLAFYFSMIKIMIMVILVIAAVSYPTTKELASVIKVLVALLTVSITMLSIEIMPNLSQGGLAGIGALVGVIFLLIPLVVTLNYLLLSMVIITIIGDLKNFFKIIPTAAIVSFAFAMIFMTATTDFHGIGGMFLTLSVIVIYFGMPIIGIIMAILAAKSMPIKEEKRKIYLAAFLPIVGSLYVLAKEKGYIR